MIPVSSVFEDKVMLSNDEIHPVDFVQLELGLFKTMTSDDMAGL